MEELSALIQQVTEKSKLIKINLIEKTNLVEQLQVEIGTLRSEKAEFEQRVNDLERELAQAKTIGHSNEQKVDLNDRIDELVREIDECIHHLKQ